MTHGLRVTVRGHEDADGDPERRTPRRVSASKISESKTQSLRRTVTLADSNCGDRLARGDVSVGKGLVGVLLVKTLSYRRVVQPAR